MKLLFLFAFVVAVSAAAIIDPVQPYSEGDRYFYFPSDSDGELHLVDAEEEEDDEFIAEYLSNNNNNQYKLFTRENPQVYDLIRFGDEESLKQSHFNPEKVTVFLAHGWLSDGYDESNQLLTEALLLNDDVNVIVLCWRRLANRSYRTARKGVPGVGAALGQFIMWLTRYGLSYEKSHLIGFSLGGHLVGNAGRTTGGKIKRITALDPAGPMWRWNSDRIAATDGQYVEVIHTNTDFLGYSNPIGDADFYPNGGDSMPGCWINTCSHLRAYQYMASTIKHDHLMANTCSSYRQARWNLCRGELYPMGNADINKNRSGIFRVNTRRRYPY